MTAARAPRPAHEPPARRAAPSRPSRSTSPAARPRSVRSVDSGQRPARPAQLLPGGSWGRRALLCTVVAFAGLLLATGVQGERIRTQERLDDLDEAVAAAELRHRTAQVELARASSPARLLDAARAEGLVDPGPVVALPAGPADPAELARPRPAPTRPAPTTTAPARTRPTTTAPARTGPTTTVPGRAGTSR